MLHLPNSQRYVYLWDLTFYVLFSPKHNQLFQYLGYVLKTVFSNPNSAYAFFSQEDDMVANGPNSASSPLYTPVHMAASFEGGSLLNKFPHASFG